MWKQFKQRLDRWRGIAIIVPSVAGIVIAGSLSGVFQLLEWATLDQFVYLRPAEKIDRRMVIVTVEESDIQQIGQWPMSDGDMARMLKNINAQKPRAIGLDIYRDLPVDPGHQELLEVFESTPNLIGIEKVGGDTVAAPPTLKEAGQVAASDTIMDADGKVRRGLLMIGTKDGELRESLGARLALMYLDAEGIELEAIDPEKSHYRLGKAVFEPLKGQAGGYVGPKTDTGGYQILLNYRGQIDRFDTISMSDVLENSIPPDLMSDRLVLIGATTPSLKDIFQTPYNNALWGKPKPMPGIAIHANLASHILNAAMEGRPMLRVWGQTTNWLWILLWSSVGATGGWFGLQTRLFKKNVFLSGTICVIVASGGVLSAIGYLAFLGGWAIPIFSPLLALTASAILIANYHHLWQLKTANEQLAATNEKLETANEQLEDYSRTLETRVEERTEALQNEVVERRRAEEEVRLLLTISMAINAAPNFETALELTLTQVCKTTGWVYGEIWVPSEDGGVLKCSPIYYCNDTDKDSEMMAALQEFRHSTESMTFDSQEGLAGRVWQSLQPEWIPTLPPESNPVFPRANLARKCGQNGAFCVPIISSPNAEEGDGVQSDRVLAVLVFLIAESCEEDRRLVELISAVAAQSGTVVQQKQAEEALRHKNVELANTLQQLQATQQELIQSEKMAALGQLVAGIAHEINTPLGAINSSVRNIANFWKDNLEKLPSFFQELPPERQPDFLNLLQKSSQADTTLSTREQRKIKRELTSQLKAHQIENSASIANLLVGIGVYDNLDSVLPILRDPNSKNIFKMASQFANVQTSTRTISTAADRAAKVVFALKTYARYSPTGDTIEANIIEGMETVLTLYHNQTKHAVEVIRQFDRSLPAIRCYPDELNQVWTNLIHNALQAMENQGTLVLEAVQQESKVRVSITDSGKGIPPEIKPKIFQPFFTTKPPGEGSGLGLDIVRKIVEKHQGQIEVESVPGKTTFTVVLPISPKKESSNV